MLIRLAIAFTLKQEHIQIRFKRLDGASHLQLNSYFPYFGYGASGAVLNSGEWFYLLISPVTCTDPADTEGFANGCGSITIDVNGFKGPNTIGRDIFAIDILEDRIVPVGSKNLANECSTSNAGRGCAAKYLSQ